MTDGVESAVTTWRWIVGPPRLSVANYRPSLTANPSRLSVSPYSPCSISTGFRRIPIPPISTSTTSPSWSSRRGSRK